MNSATGSMALIKTINRRRDLDGMQGSSTPFSEQYILEHIVYFEALDAIAGDPNSLEGKIARAALGRRVHSPTD